MRRFARALAAWLGLTLVAGCAWDDYWREDTGPTGPQVPHDTTAPTVTLATPTGPDSLHATPVSGATYKIEVEATDDVAVRSVHVYVDDVELGEVDAPPWRVPWNTTILPEGSCHRLRATAADSSGNVGESGVAWAQAFNAGPRVVLVEPADSALVLGTVPVTVEFPDQTPDIAKVEFLADVFTVATVTSPPWSFHLDTTTLLAGSHYLAAKATTVLGGVGVSTPVRVYVNNGHPTVSISFPDNGHRVATQGTLVMVGSASDAVQGPLRPDQLAWRSDLQGLLGTGHELWKSNLAVGTHTIYAVATNSWGTAESTSVQVEVMAQPTYSYCQEIHWGLFEPYFCTFCHIHGSSQFPDSQLDLTTYAWAMHGGKSQAIYHCIYPCRPESSLVYNKISAAVPWVGGQMPVPPTFPPVPPSLQQKLWVWISEGAPPDVGEDCQK
ncbi:MAG: Ig-like domain-containing protein [bacterium]